MDTFKSRGRIIAGVAFDIPGMGYKNPRTGLIEGFEADLARAIAEKLLGAPDRIDFFQVTDEQRLPALQSDRVDMVLSQITITRDRAEQVDFSIPYYVTREAILVPKDALVLNACGASVFVVRDGIASAINVQVGHSHESLVEVEANLRPGEPVVIRGNERLIPGQRVTIIPKKTKTETAPSNSGASTS